MGAKRPKSLVCLEREKRRNKEEKETIVRKHQTFKK